MQLRDLSSVTAADVQRLVDTRAQEGLDLEFKRELNLAQNSDRKELARDISSMANSSGCQVLYGIDEQEVDGVKCAAAIVPLTTEGLDELLADIISTTISPRVYVRTIRIEVPGGYVLLVDVPQSLGDLHMVAGYGEFRYYKRGAKGRVPMTEPEVRERYSRIAAQRAQLDSTLSSLTATEMQLRANTDESIVFVPWFARTDLIDLRALTSLRRTIGDVIEDGGDMVSLTDEFRFTRDGLVAGTDEKYGEGNSTFLLAIRASGVIHLSCNVALQKQHDGTFMMGSLAVISRTLWATIFAREVYRLCGYHERVRVCYELRSETPFTVDTATFFSAGRQIAAGRIAAGPFDVEWRELEMCPRRITKDILDRLYQARGDAACPRFDGEGKLAQAHRREFQRKPSILKALVE